MSRPRVRAVVLAAGLGTRLRPLTETLPKPLLPVVGRPLATHTLARLQEWGCEAAALNLHHLGTDVREKLGDSYRGLSLTYSVEPGILGTLGALRPLREFLEPADLILVVNGDSLCRWPIGELVRRHLESSAAATLLFSTNASVASFGGGVRIDASDQVRAFRNHDPTESTSGDRYRVFAGAHLLSAELLERVPDAKSDFVSDLYEPLVAEGRAIGALETDTAWHDLGTPARYLAAALAWIPNGEASGRRRDSWIATDATVDRDAVVEAAVVERGVRIARGAVVEHSLVLPGAHVTAGCRVRRSIVGPGARIAPGVALEGVLATRAGDFVDPSHGASSGDPLVRTTIF